MPGFRRVAVSRITGKLADDLDLNLAQESTLMMDTLCAGQWFPQKARRPGGVGALYCG
jgi:hypothetical protein